MYEFSLSTKPVTASSRRAKRLSLPCMQPVCSLYVSEHLWTLRAHCFLAKALQTWDKRVPLKREHWALFRFRLKLLMVSAVAPYTCRENAPVAVVVYRFCLYHSVWVAQLKSHWLALFGNLCKMVFIEYFLVSEFAFKILHKLRMQ